MAVTIPAAPRRLSDHAPIEVALESLTGDLAAEWESLADAARASAFLRPGYIEIWLRAFGDGTSPSAVVARRDGRLAGALAVRRRGARLEPAGDFETPVCGIVADDAVAMRAVAEKVFALGARRVTIKPLIAGAPSTGALEAAATGSGHRASIRTMMLCPTVATSGAWEDYWASLSRNTRHKVQRCDRRLHELGAVTIGVEDGAHDLDARLQEGLEIEAAGWKADEGTAVLTRPAAVGYYRDLARWAAGRGWLRLTFVRVDGRPIAFALGVEQGGVHHALKIGYDPEFARLSPGTLLLRELIRHCFDAGVRTFDFAGRDEPYKSAWATGMDEHLELTAFPRSPAGWAARHMTEARRGLGSSRLRPVLERMRRAGGPRGG